MRSARVVRVLNRCWMRACIIWMCKGRCSSAWARLAGDCSLVARSEMCGHELEDRRNDLTVDGSR
jgi:hypothetical protein